MATEEIVDLPSDESSPPPPAKSRGGAGKNKWLFIGGGIAAVVVVVILLLLLLLLRGGGSAAPGELLQTVPDDAWTVQIWKYEPMVSRRYAASGEGRCGTRHSHVRGPRGFPWKV